MYLRLAKQRFFQSLSAFPNPCHFWSTINKLHKINTSIPSLNYNSHSLTSPQSKAEVLNSFFSSCFNKSSPPPFSCPTRDSLYTKTELPTSSPVYSQILPDSISAKMDHSTAPSISAPFSIIFNSSLSTGALRSDWKSSTIIPIPKTSPPSSSPTYYHPISLLFLVSEALEHHLFDYLFNHITHNLLSNRQFVFHPGFSTETALL